MSVWTKKTGRFGDSNGNQCSLQVFCGVVGITYNIPVNYVCEKKRINQEVGHGVGRNSLISENNQKFVTDVMARKDSANEGMNMVEGLDLILEVIPQLSWKQSKQ